MPRNAGAFLFKKGQKIMRKIFLLFMGLASPLLMAQTPSWNWVKKSTGDINEGVACVTTDLNGNIYAAGSIISSDGNFGLGPVANNGYADYFVVKYNSAGVPLWMKNGGGTGNEIIYNMTTDSNGNLYAVVSFQSATVTFGSFTISNTATVPDITGLLPYDLALVKYDANGTVLWVRKIGGTQDETSGEVSCDAQGNVYVNAFSVSQVVTAGNLSVSAIQNSLVAGFLSKFDSSGTPLWIKRFGNNNDAGTYISAPTFDASGNCYLTGRFNIETFTLGTTTYTNVAPGINDSFIVKLDSGGAIVWQKVLQGNGDDRFATIMIIQNELYVPFTVASSNLTSPTVYSYDGVNYNNPASTKGIMKLNFNGQVNAIIYNSGLSGIIKTDGVSLYVAGNFITPTLTFGTTTLTNTNSSTSLPSEDIYVAKMNTSGQFLWAKSANGTNNESILGFAIDSSGNLFLGGYFDSPSMTFGSTILSNTSQSGYVDAFVAKLNTTLLSTPAVENTRMVIYPSPTKDVVYISSNEGIHKVVIFDTAGRIVDTQYETAQINLKTFNSGIYYLTIETDKGVFSKKIVKE